MFQSFCVEYAGVYVSMYMCIMYCLRRHINNCQFICSVHICVCVCVHFCVCVHVSDTKPLPVDLNLIIHICILIYS